MAPAQGQARQGPIGRFTNRGVRGCMKREDITMATIRKEILVEAPAESVWAAVRDIGALHKRLVPGFVVDTRLEADARVVTFGNGMVVRELIVDLDDEARRLAWSARGGRLTHHNASVQVFADGEGRSRLVWIADLLPNEVAGDIRAMIEQAAAIMKPTLEGRAREG
jgi:carbon monoxide dehydrogenase subunit G